MASAAIECVILLIAWVFFPLLPLLSSSIAGHVAHIAGILSLMVASTIGCSTIGCSTIGCVKHTHGANFIPIFPRALSKLKARLCIVSVAFLLAPGAQAGTSAVPLEVRAARRNRIIAAATEARTDPTAQAQLAAAITGDDYDSHPVGADLQAIRVEAQEMRLEEEREVRDRQTQHATTPCGPSWAEAFSLSF